MFLEELKSKQQQQSLFSDSLKKGNENSEQETLYADSKKNKPEFKAIDPTSVSSHQKNKGGYKNALDALSVKQEAGGSQQQKGSGTVQAKKKKEPTHDQYKKMSIGKEPMSMSTIQYIDEKEEMYAKNIPKINLDVEFTSPLPESMKGKLKAAAFFLINKTEHGMYMGDFYQNSITTMVMGGKDFDLSKLSADEKKKYGGNTVFEFMRLENIKDGNTEKACIQIRELGQETAVMPDEATKKKQEEHFKKHFSLDASWTDSKEIERLYHAVSLIPSSILSSIPNTAFRREAMNVDGRGNQHPETLAQHVMNGLGEASITVFDSAFKDDGSMRYGDATSGFFGPLEQAIIHEIGHAFNGRRIKKALSDEAERSQQWMSAYDTKVGCRDKRIKGKQCRGLDKKMDDLEAKERVTEAAVAAARTETGYGYDSTADDLYVDKQPDAPFRKALEKDGGKAITKYAEKDIEEHYAELFSLYFIDEARLKKMRPAVHEYFKTNYPK